MKFANPLASEKKPKTPTYNMTVQQLQQLADDAHKQGMVETVPIINAMYSAAMLLALNSLYGWSGATKSGKPGALKTVFDQTQKYFEELRDGEIKYSDIAKELEMFGVNLIVEKLEGGWEDAIAMFQRSELGQNLKVRMK